MTTPTTPDKSAPEKGMPKRHRWNADGEKCLDCGDSDWMNDPVCHPRTPAQETGQQDGDYEGATPSSQKGGCDYMSFSDAKKLFQKYIDCEMRDPNGLDELAKAMLSYNRAISHLSAEKNYVGESFEELFGAFADWENEAYSRGVSINDYDVEKLRLFYDFLQSRRSAPSSPREGKKGKFKCPEGLSCSGDGWYCVGDGKCDPPAQSMDVEKLIKDTSNYLEISNIDVRHVINYLVSLGIIQGGKNEY